MLHWKIKHIDFRKVKYAFMHNTSFGLNLFLIYQKSRIDKNLVGPAQLCLMPELMSDTVKILFVISYKFISIFPNMFQDSSTKFAK